MIYALIVAAKIALFYTWDTDTSWFPFITTQYTSHSNIIEAQYLISKSYHPYNTHLIFQKPLLVYFLNHFDSRLYYLIIDLLVGHFISIAFSNKQGYQKAVRVFYHLNPLTFLSLMALNTDGIDYLLLVLIVYLMQNQQSLRQVFASLLFGILIYLNPQYFIVIAVIALMLRIQNSTAGGFVTRLLFFLAATLLTVLACVYFSFELTGDWSFVQKCYIDLYFPKDHKPTLGFLWALMSGLFSKYKVLYHALYMIFPACYIIPFYNLFAKYSDRQKESVGLMLGVTLFSSFIYFQQVTAMNLFVVFLFIFSRYDLVFNNVSALPTIATGSFIACLAARLLYMWTNSTTGNPNFPFFQIFISHIFFVVLVTETTREMLIEYAKKRLERKKQKND